MLTHIFGCCRYVYNWDGWTQTDDSFRYAEMDLGLKGYMPLTTRRYEFLPQLLHKAEQYERSLITLDQWSPFSKCCTHSDSLRASSLKVWPQTERACDMSHDWMSMCSLKDHGNVKIALCA